MVTIRTDKGAGGGHGTVGERVAAEFTSQEQHLRSLRWLDAPVSEISSTIKQYLSALCRNRSIALSRGETLSSTRLSRRLENVFTTAAPKVIAGPPISWTSLVLSVGPFYTGTGQLRIGESEIRLSKDDFDLLRSGRAWRFLSPWPGADDCLTELQAIETSMEELLSLKQSLTIVMENISSVEYQLLHRRNAVTQRAQNMSTIRKPVEPSRQCPRNPEDAVSRCEADSSHLDEKSPLRESQVTPLSVENLREPYNRDLSISALTQGSSPSEPASDTVGLWGATYFIQNLCSILDDPENEQIMCWSSDGCSFYVAEKSRFLPELLIRLQTADYKSLVRRLYYYGFHKRDGFFYHEFFIRGQYHSFNKIRPPPRRRRKIIKGKQV